MRFAFPTYLFLRPVIGPQQISVILRQSLANPAKGKTAKG